MKEISPRPRGWGLFRDESDNLFEGFLRPVEAREAGGDGRLVPRIDVTEQDRQFVVEAELPGVKKENIAITMRDGVLTISADTLDASEAMDGGRVIRRERRYGRFVRSMSFGPTVDDANIAARYNDGILRVTVPKTAPRQPEKIKITVR
jgi:HSP20 family protein